MLDCSNKRKGNHSYFNDLGTCVESDEVGKAFYSYLKGVWEKEGGSFDSAERPETENRRVAVAENVPSIIRYIKYQFLPRKTDMNITHQDLKAELKIVLGTQHIKDSTIKS